jgi:hypothetical protein
MWSADAPILEQDMDVVSGLLFRGLKGFFNAFDVVARFIVPLLKPFLANRSTYPRGIIHTLIILAWLGIWLRIIGELSRGASIFFDPVPRSFNNSPSGSSRLWYFLRRCAAFCVYFGLNFNMMMVWNDY